jgi:hypothetical protein
MSVSTIVYHLRNDLFPNPQTPYTLSRHYDLARQIAAENCRILRPKDIRVLHDPVNRVDSHTMDFNHHMSAWRITVWRSSDYEGSTLRFQRPCCHVGRSGGCGCSHSYAERKVAGRLVRWMEAGWTARPACVYILPCSYHPEVKQLLRLGFVS